MNKNINEINKYDKIVGKKYFIETFGCQMNENDTEKLGQMLRQMGYICSSDKGDSQLIILNTCCVRENAEQKVYGHLGALKNYKKENPEVIIAVCGCMMQQKDVVNHIYKTYKHVDIVFGTYNTHMLPAYIHNLLENKSRVIDIWDKEDKIIENVPYDRDIKIQSLVTIMYGCNNFCSYCIVPYVRGRERSRQVDDIVDEVKLLAENGCKEITLLGQNVNSYGVGLDKKATFSDLLYILNQVNGLERIRFMTSHPKDMSDELIYAIKECDKVCNALHLPVQAGSSKVLRDMNRIYTKEHYLKLIEKVKNTIPGIALTTDIIVGFPGETEEDFLDTIDVIKKVRFDMAYTFLYSIRSGTPAATRDDQVLEDVKKRRFNELLDLQNTISNEINNTYYNKTVKVLVEGASKNNDGMLTGRTETNKVVNFSGDKILIGKIINVKITKVQTWSLGGEII